MKHILVIPLAWRPDPHTLIHAGEWMVPEHLSEELSALAIDEANAYIKDGSAAMQSAAAPVLEHGAAVPLAAKEEHKPRCGRPPKTR